MNSWAVSFSVYFSTTVVLLFVNISLADEAVCEVGEWSAWGDCVAALCSPCDYGNVSLGWAKPLKTASTDLFLPDRFPPETMIKIRGPLIQGMMDKKDSFIQDIVRNNKGGSSKMQNSYSTLDSTPCVDGSAAGYPCSDVDLEWWRTNTEIGAGSANDNWGWTSSDTGVEYALAAMNSGTAFLRVADGSQVGFLPTATSSSSWRDIKVYDHYAFIVSEASSHGLQIFDLKVLDAAEEDDETFDATLTYQEFGSAHNIAINEETSRAYVIGSNTCGGGMHAIDIRDPLEPVFVGCAWETDYVHDAQCVVYRGPDVDYFGKEICFVYSADEIRIIDVTPYLPSDTLISRLQYEGVSYAHQGWLNCEQDTLLVDDEKDEGSSTLTRTYVVDISTLSTPYLVRVHESGETAIDHNQYTCGAYTFQANYEAGLRILDSSAAKSARGLVEVAYFDTYPSRTLGNFNGNWNAFPFFESGRVLVNSIGGGVGVVTPTNLRSENRTRSFSYSTNGDALARQACPLLVEQRGCTADPNPSPAPSVTPMPTVSVLPSLGPSVSCPWFTPMDEDDILGCGDGTECAWLDEGYDCCGDHDGRARCPANYPFMCAEDNICGGSTDHCCATSISGCDDQGGLRLCVEVAPSSQTTLLPSSSQPTLKPSLQPTLIPSVACRDDDGWYYKKNKPNKGCTWVAKKTGNRCSKTGADGRIASEACKVTCSSCCSDDDVWYKKNRPDKDCTWVKNAPDIRCSKRGHDGRSASDACEVSCKTCS